MKYGNFEVQHAAHRSHFLQDCVRELSNCRDHSIGASVLLLLGNRLGDVQLPFAIPGDKYEVLLNHAKESRSREELGMFEEWYQKDTNAIPTVYCLKRLPQDNRNY